MRKFRGYGIYLTFLDRNDEDLPYKLRDEFVRGIYQSYREAYEVFGKEVDRLRHEGIPENAWWLKLKSWWIVQESKSIPEHVESDDLLCCYLSALKHDKGGGYNDI